MTDKQIIYNCPHISLTDWGTYACKLYNPRDKNCLVKGGNCVSNISCPYKQFKAKEQECEELKDLADHNGRVCNERLDKIDELEHDINELNGQLNQLKTENDELRIKNRILETECNEMRDVCDEFEQYYESLMQEHKKLKQTLTEIKEIAEICKCHNADGCYECKYFNDCEVEDEEIPSRDVCKLILQKISECEMK